MTSPTNNNSGISSSPFVLNASQLTTFQRCPRRYLIERSWRVIRWRPRSLFAHCIRAAILQLSQGTPIEDAISLARARFMSQAADPGLDVPRGRDTYILASDFCAMLGTTLLAISRSTLPVLGPASPHKLTNQISWLPSSFADESGALHRWVITDSWDADAISRELHSWHTIGDMTIADSSLTLHVIVIGQSRDGRLQSPWCRAYAHPMIAGKIRFQARQADGRPRRLSGEHWRPVWLSDLQIGPVEWLQKMDADRVTEGLLIEGAVKQPSAAASAEVLRQIISESEAMRSLSLADPLSVPMSRPACDGIVRCPWQEACYSESPTMDLSGLGLYQLRPQQEMRGVDGGERSGQPPLARHAIEA
jgi:hypothetical protein